MVTVNYLIIEIVISPKTKSNHQLSGVCTIPPHTHQHTLTHMIVVPHTPHSQYLPNSVQILSNYCLTHCLLNADNIFRGEEGEGRRGLRGERMVHNCRKDERDEKREWDEKVCE